MKKASVIEEVIKEANKLIRVSEGKNEFNQHSYLMGVIEALLWARHNDIATIQVTEDIVLQ